MEDILLTSLGKLINPDCIAKFYLINITCCCKRQIFSIPFIKLTAIIFSLELTCYSVVFYYNDCIPSPLMVLVQRVSYVAFAYHDG